MRIDLPCCGFKNCRYCFDGNCMKPSEQEKCEYWYLLHPPCTDDYCEIEEPQDGFTKWAKSVADGYRNGKEEAE